MDKTQNSPETSKKAPNSAKPPKEPMDTTKSENLAREPLEAPEAQLDAKNLAKIAELTADLQRTRADFENYRKNLEKDKENLRKNTKFAEVMKILPLLDDFERAIATYPELKPLEKNLQKTLKSLNLEKINSKPGTEFNPNFHEAIMTEGDGDKELISETLRPGYLYEGEVLRPAMVKIALS